MTEYRQCTRCILDTSDDSQILFDEQGVCSYCITYDQQKSTSLKTDDDGKQELQKWVNEIRKAGAGKPYDCILGLSGGVDSTYLALKAKELGLRPLTVHFDNGWNSELAVANIENIITRLGFDLHTVVVDWEEFRDLQLAFLRASVVDIELVTDHAIIASLYQIALKNKVKYILSGVNYVTESILPSSWIHDKRDHVHIKAINRLFGTRPLVKFPLLNSNLILRAAWAGIQSVALLNYMDYVKSDVKKEITSQLHWRDYGGKHYESIFTRFYQGYILVKKFGVDKRKAHLSNLICSGQLTRDEALNEISKSAYPTELFQKDYEFVLKKFGLTEGEFESIMDLPSKKHCDYPVNQGIYKRFPLLEPLAPLWGQLKKMKGGKW